MSRINLFVLLVLLPGDAGAGPGLRPEFPGDSAEPVEAPARLTGRVILDGPVPELWGSPITSEPAVCGEGRKPSEALVLGPDRGVANVIVTLPDLPSGREPAALDAVLDQRTCVFVPHVQRACPGQLLTLVNSDATMHNVHAFTVEGMKDTFNVGLGLLDQRLEQRLPRSAGPLVIRCDAGHRWMLAYIYVVPNPYHAQTGPDGEFEIDGIPPGRHRVMLWHEYLGQVRTELEFPPGGQATLRVAGRTAPRRALVPETTPRRLRSRPPLPPAGSTAR